MEVQLEIQTKVFLLSRSRQKASTPIVILAPRCLVLIYGAQIRRGWVNEQSVTQHQQTDVLQDTIQPEHFLPNNHWHPLFSISTFHRSLQSQCLGILYKHRLWLPELIPLSGVATMLGSWGNAFFASINEHTRQMREYDLNKHTHTLIGSK